MIGTLQKIDITDEMIWKLAKFYYGKLNDDDLCDQSERVKSNWYHGTLRDLDTFNQLVTIFKECKINCRVEVYGCGHDVMEYYKE